MEYRHCDEYIRDKSQPMVLRKFLLYKRIPAYWQFERWKESWGKPKLYATLFFDKLSPKQTYDLRKMLDLDKRKESVDVNVVMASRFGDVGITTNLDASNGYEARVPVEWLSNFRDKN